MSTPVSVHKKKETVFSLALYLQRILKKNKKNGTSPLPPSCMYKSAKQQQQKYEIESHFFSVSHLLWSNVGNCNTTECSASIIKKRTLYFWRYYYLTYPI